MLSDAMTRLIVDFHNEYGCQVELGSENRLDLCEPEISSAVCVSTLCGAWARGKRVWFHEAIATCWKYVTGVD
jgi:hypothetical protein